MRTQTQCTSIQIVPEIPRFHACVGGTAQEQEEGGEKKAHNSHEKAAGPVSIRGAVVR